MSMAKSEMTQAILVRKAALGLTWETIAEKSGCVKITMNEKFLPYKT